MSSSRLTLPRIYTGKDEVDMVDYVDINFSSLSLTTAPTITASASEDVNIFISDITTSTARINFSAEFVGEVNYTVIGFN